MSVVLNPTIVGEAGFDALSPINVVFPSTQEITIDAANDSIKVGDGAGHFAAVSAAGAVKVDNSAVTQPISAASLPLPANAATSALQTSGNASLSSIDTKLTSPLAVTGPLTDTQLRATPVPVSGTVTASPSGNYTVVQPTGTNLHTVVDSGAVTATLSAETTKVIGTVNVSAGQTIAVTNAGTFATQAAQSGVWNLTNISGTVSLPTGASTSALQTTGNTSLSSMDAKTPALGQALAAASSPVVLTAAQVTTLTPLSTVAVTQSGTWSVGPATGTLTDRSGTAQATSTQIAASNATRKYFFIQNTGAKTLWFNFTTAAVAASPSIRLLPYEIYELDGDFVSTEAINVIRGSTPAPTFTAKEG